MDRKSTIDTTGAILLIVVSMLLGVNQVLMKLVNLGMAPVFQAGLRSACAVLPVFAVIWLSGRRIEWPRSSVVPGCCAGLLFAAEFVALFNAVDLTTVARASVLFYTMPVWVAVGAHWLIPGERMTPLRGLGLVLAVSGVMLALSDHKGGGSLQGDLLALSAAFGWASIALLTRTTALSRAMPEVQLLFQLIVSAPILIGLALFSGPIWREMTLPLWGVFAFQVLAVVTFGFITWFWMLRRYPAAQVASFSFLAPVFGVVSGWMILGEPVTLAVWLALALVGAGIWCVNRG